MREKVDEIKANLKSNPPKSCCQPESRVRATSGSCHVSLCLQTRIPAMNVTDITSSRSFGGRKRSWGEEQCEPPKRISHTWIRESPLVIMDEPTRPMFLPPSPVSRSVSPPAIRSDPTVALSEISRPLKATGTAPDSARSLDPVQVGSSAKKRFAIGPRTNCQKCLAREPGHYGHWL
ncbi:hypothetical protein AG1IA_01347 [Rhizoctonia solani AG-1 IA]|uniref:Uncharacterized protein n=1 Tax=Thanatephorus cucumeris (strain AG1-IA) TaxID=983506 RepID=L8X316_THACA|nr:hypothetical protein AG1IA_01347 [Rhizoctonia solani AG-1 IA]